MVKLWTIKLLIYSTSDKRCATRNIIKNIISLFLLIFNFSITTSTWTRYNSISRKVLENFAMYTNKVYFTLSSRKYETDTHREKSIRIDRCLFSDVSVTRNSCTCYIESHRNSHCFWIQSSYQTYNPKKKERSTAVGWSLHAIVYTKFRVT